MASSSLIVLILVILLGAIFVIMQGAKILLLKKRLGEAIVGTEKRNIQLSYLVKTTQTLSSALSKDRLLRLIIETVGDISKSDRTLSRCALYLMDYNVNGFVYETGFNMDVTMLCRPSFGSDDAPFKALKKDRKISFFDESSNIKNVFFKGSKLHMLNEIDHGIMIPLIVEDEIMGVVVSFLAKSSCDFLKNEYHLLQTVTGMIAMALGSAVQSELAVLDRLTKVYNHAYFEGRLSQEVARSDRYQHPLSVLMIDIDHFKRINDTYGHQQGDAILKEVANAIKSNTRVVDLCARYGGEEFGIILPETDLTAEPEKKEIKKSGPSGGAIARAENLRKTIENMEVVSPEGLRVKLTVSIGIGVKRFPEGAGMGKDQLIKEADKLLYRAKQEGRNRVCHP
ncbi:MAG: sensor domain-containing diguanylate cyclase [Candidatus Omnitrophica bacterium]|nr:sensor domain-containing diguanylate cyclase [Candidatus Omnitrophota bacterium]